MLLGKTGIAGRSLIAEWASPVAVAIIMKKSRLDADLDAPVTSQTVFG